MSRGAKLALAYRDARYVVHTGRDRLCFAIGRADAIADAGMRRAGCRTHWCLITPCNPGSRRLPARQNERRLALMRAIVQRHGWRMLPAYNAAADGRWAEPGLCLLDRPLLQAQRIARRFGQSAWVLGQLGAAPQLVWTI